MKRQVAILIVFAMVLAGCAAQQGGPSTFLETQYKALAASQELYNMTWGAFVQLYRTQAVDSGGKIIVDKATYDQGRVYANTYYHAWMTWINAVVEYGYGGAGDDKGKVSVEKTMAICQRAALDLMKLIQPYLAAEVKK